MKLNEVYEELTEEQFDEKAGKKDACYSKVKARYKVWPVHCICVPRKALRTGAIVRKMS